MDETCERVDRQAAFGHAQSLWRQEYFRQLKDEGLAEATVRQTRAMMHRACRLARKWSSGTLLNPIADTELPTWSIEQREELRAPSVKEVLILIATAEKLDSSFAAVIRVVAATGMRRGEVCALRRSDVDLGAATIRINDSVVAAKGGDRVVAKDQGQSSHCGRRSGHGVDASSASDPTDFSGQSLWSGTGS